MSNEPLAPPGGMYQSDTGRIAPTTVTTSDVLTPDPIGGPLDLSQLGLVAPSAQTGIPMWYDPTIPKSAYNPYQLSPYGLIGVLRPEQLNPLLGYTPTVRTHTPGEHFYPETGTPSDYRIPTGEQSPVYGTARYTQSWIDQLYGPAASEQVKALQVQLVKHGFLEVASGVMDAKTADALETLFGIANLNGITYQDVFDRMDEAGVNANQRTS